MNTKTNNKKNQEVTANIFEKQGIIEKAEVVKKTTEILHLA
jgi:hypothetical protein